MADYKNRPSGELAAKTVDVTAPSDDLEYREENAVRLETNWQHFDLDLKPC